MDSLCNSNSSITEQVEELKQTPTERRIYLKDKQVAEKLSVAILNGDNATLNPKLKTPIFSGIARYIPMEIDGDSLVTMIPNCGRARSFKLQFSAKADLDQR